MKTPDRLLEQNQRWSESIRQQQPDFFQQLSLQQKPGYLWIGCSDSRVPANQIVDAAPGEIFVHRNIANTVIHTDLNCLSVIQYAIEVLKIRHIIVCGHYGCGGVLAAMENQRHGLIDNWLLQIKNTQQLYQQELSGLDTKKRFDRLCELNVIEQVKNVARSTIIQSAWDNGHSVHVYGWIYDLSCGRLRDLGCNVASNQELAKLNAG